MNRRKSRKINCDRKVKHSSKKAAEDAMWGYIRRNLGGKKFNSEAYRCGDHWHWGHYSGKRR